MPGKAFCSSFTASWNIEYGKIEHPLLFGIALHQFMLGMNVPWRKQIQQLRVARWAYRQGKSQRTDVKAALLI